jgi:phosphoribosylformylglycinamidine synthase
VIVLVGETEVELGGSEYLKVAHDLVSGRPPALDLALERDVQRAVVDAIGAGLVKSAHDCSEGGIAVTLAESCIIGGIGATLALDDGLQPAASLFSETQSRIVVTVAPADTDALTDLLLTHDVPYSVLGEVGGDSLVIEDKADLTIAELRAAWEPTLAALVRGQVMSDEIHEG